MKDAPSLRSLERFHWHQPHWPDVQTCPLCTGPWSGLQVGLCEDRPEQIWAIVLSGEVDVHLPDHTLILSCPSICLPPHFQDTNMEPSPPREQQREPKRWAGAEAERLRKIPPGALSSYPFSEFCTMWFYQLKV